MVDLSLTLSATGGVTPVGFDIKTTAASIRAGINRFGPLEDTTVFDEDEMEAPLTGAQVPLITDGFIQQARWLRMIKQSIVDLIDNRASDAADIDWPNTPVIFILPTTIECFKWPDEAVGQLLQTYVVDVLNRQLGITLMMPPNGFYLEGASGVARALLAIDRTMKQSTIQQCLLVAVDSLIEPSVLGWLDENERLKSPENPLGLMPSEGATALLMESGDSNTAVNVLNAVHQSWSSDDENWRTNDAGELGRQLALSILTTLGGFESTPFTGDIYLDINGEYWRSQIWGIALSMLQGKPVIHVDKCQEIISASSVGDIGAASGGLGLSLAEQSYEQGYATANMALVCSVSDDGHIGVVLLGAG